MNFIKSEIKKWSRDPMMGFMVIYPIFFAMMGRYLLPWIGDRYGFDFIPYTDLILVIMVLIIPISYGALIGFSILEDRDDNIIINIRATPLSIHKFLSFRLVMVFFLCFSATLFTIVVSNIVDFSPKNVIAVAFLASLEAPMAGLLINSFSKNKIEGFAVMKAGGSIIIFPIVALFFSDIRELFFSFAPGFWTGKVISCLIRGNIFYLSCNQYYIIGLGYMLLLNVLVYRLFIRRVILN
ncbi:MAG TPA: ABC transporter permease [Clostridia bacterium]|nr:ABC transporter permease [Clostridia bacterium]